MINEAEVEECTRYIIAAYAQHTPIRVQPAIAEEVVRDFLRFAKKSRHLLPGEYGVVSLFQPMVSALVADRVWLPDSGKRPELDFSFGWDSPGAIRLSAMMALHQVSEDYEADLVAPRIPDMQAQIHRFSIDTCRDLSADFSRLSSAVIVPMYHTPEARDADYTPGSRDAILAVLQNLEVVDESQLSWEQVLEFRADERAKQAYHRLVHWLDGNMLGKSVQFITDEVGGRLESYEWALRKHGLRTVTGSLASTLDSKYLAGTSAVAAVFDLLTQSPGLAACAASTLVVGKTALALAERLIDREDIVMAHREIAFVHEVKHRFADAD